MKSFTNTKKTKKLIIALVMLILFNFCYPLTVKAFFIEDIIAAPAKIFWTLGEAVYKMLNNMFVRDKLKAVSVTSTSIKLTPENIIKGRFILFDANIFREIDADSDYYDYEADSSIVSGKISLREIIAGWYYAMRDLAILALLSVLVYVGIRMIMSTVAQDKVKYKMMFKDWLVALCLLMVMHYMMIGILNISTEITEAISGVNNETSLLGKNVTIIKRVLSKNYYRNEGDMFTDYVWRDGSTLYEIGDAYAQLVVFFGILGYTFIFAVKYLKREFTIIFLILLGPISCITYPIDKISDGKAQAFNKWFSEFLYQVIIQPFHLLLYMVLIGSATELASANVLYAIICFAVMIPAEKFVKAMFGFKDQLGSPLGFAGGAIAAKALGSIFAGDKKDGVKKGGADNSGAQNSLPPKTVDKDKLVAGGDKEKESADNKVSQNENPEIEKGANEEESDNQGNANLDADEEENQNADLDVGEDKNNSANLGAGEDGSDQRPSLLGRLYNVHNERAAKKWGSTDVKQRWKNRGKKLLGKTAKVALRTAAVGAGAIGLGALGMMFGKGASWAGAGATLGSALGNKVIKGARGAVDTAKDYRAALNPQVREKYALNAFKADRGQIDKAIQSYQSRNGTTEALTPEQLDQELNDRFELSRYGLNDEQIDKAIESYQELKEDGMSQEDALNETVFATKLANDYSKKDFRTEKTMADAARTISERFQERGAGKSIADAYAEKYLRRAAKIKGSEIALPSTNQTVDVQLPPTEIANSLGVRQADMDKVQLERMNNITVRLHKAGFKAGDIKNIAANSGGGSVAEVLDRYEAQVEYLDDQTAQDEARKTIEIVNNGSNATPQQVNAEMRERLILKSTFDVKDEQEITAMRDLENETFRERSQVEVAREFANQNRGRLNNQAHMEGEKQRLITELMNGGSSSGKAAKDAENIIKMAVEYNNEIITWKNN